MTGYTQTKVLPILPRLPLEGSIDITYRCNNNCRHCWINMPAGAPERKKELAFEEIRDIADQAQAMGCRKWSISGGEPMLRPDFPEIFDYLTRTTLPYTLNTNGTLITPEIAGLMKRKGNKMVALYGATRKVHDHVTRNPGSFDAVMRGMSYLKEAGASFTVQLIPMRDNYHQWNKMIKLAETMSPRWRVGAAWLWLSASGDPEKNREIIRQRLSPDDVIELDHPDMSYSEPDTPSELNGSHCHRSDDNRLFASCIGIRRNFHIDPYGGMSFCHFIQDPGLRYDLRTGSFNQGWDEFIPALVDKVPAGPRYREGCGVCNLRPGCRWCPVYAYLEHRDYSAKVEYLCAVAEKKKQFEEAWQKNHRRYYQIAGITVQVDSDLPITDKTFAPKFECFRQNMPGEEIIAIRHHFSLPDLINETDLGKEMYRKPPWAIFKKGKSWIYLGFTSPGPAKTDEGSRLRPNSFLSRFGSLWRRRKRSSIDLGETTINIHQVAVFNNAHTRAEIYHDNEKAFRRGGLASLTLFPTDQILIARVLADRQACFIHAAGVILNGHGLLFVGHSSAGKSTITNMLRNDAEILCDDRMIIRRWPDGFRIHGTWSHGDIAEVSANSAPLAGILFLAQAPENRLVPMENTKEIREALIPCLVRPFVTADWWNKIFTLVEQITREVPCNMLYFDQTGDVANLLKQTFMEHDQAPAVKMRKNKHHG